MKHTTYLNKLVKDLDIGDIFYHKSYVKLMLIKVITPFPRGKYMKVLVKNIITKYSSIISINRFKEVKVVENEYKKA